MKIMRPLICCLFLFCSSFVFAQIPEVQYSGDLSFIAGGIGSDESEAIQADAKKWPLMLQFSQIDSKGWGSWISGARVQVSDKQNQQIFDFVCDGPFLLLGLKPGQYVIEATYDGVSQKRVVLIRPNQSEKQSIYWR